MVEEDGHFPTLPGSDWTSSFCQSLTCSRSNLLEYCCLELSRNHQTQTTHCSCAPHE